MFSNCVDEILRFIFILKTLFRQFHILPVIDLKNLFPLCTVVRLCCYELWSNAEERLSIINSYSQRKCYKFSITLNPFIWSMSFLNSYFFLFSLFFFFFFWSNFKNFSKGKTPTKEMNGLMLQTTDAGQTRKTRKTGCRHVHENRANNT